MKIAHIVPIFLPHKTGMGNAAYHMAIEAVRRGHEVFVFTPRYGAEESDESYNGLRVVRLTPFLKYGKAAFIPQLLFRLRGFDILHLHYPFFGGAEAVWLLKKVDKGVRLFISYHMDVVGTGLRATLFKTYTRVLLRPVITAANRVIVSSYDYADSSYINGIVNRKNLVEIPFGIDELFSPAGKDEELMRRLGIVRDEIVILFVGNFEYFKGIDCLLRSLQVLKGKVKVVIVGDGKLMPSYKNMSVDLGVSHKVCFVGFVGDEEIVKYYNLCDIFILPSLDRTEAFGIVLIEAMGCGKPVIASNLPGIRTIVDNEENGFLIDPGNEIDIADKLQRLVDREDLRRAFGKRGREKVLKKYLWGKVGSNLNKLYEELA